MPLLAAASWFGIIQATVATTLGDGFTRSLAAAGVLGTVTVLVYRLGVWRQEMENTKHNVGAEVKAHRDESTANFARLDRQLDGIAKRLNQLERGRKRVVREVTS